MLGVTLFGIFLTPVFFYVIEGGNCGFPPHRLRWTAPTGTKRHGRLAPQARAGEMVSDGTTIADNHEQDYCRVADGAERIETLAGTNIEIVRRHGTGEASGTPIGDAAGTQTAKAPVALRHVLFDFDGTLSLIREGWPEVMVPLMVEVLQATGTGEPAVRTAAAVCRLRRRADRQANDLPDDPPGRGGQPPRREAGGPPGLQAVVPRPAERADRRPARGAAAAGGSRRGKWSCRIPWSCSTPCSSGTSRSTWPAGRTSRS